MKNKLQIFTCLILLISCSGCFYLFNRTARDTLAAWSIVENKLSLICRRNVDKVLDPIANIQGHSQHQNVEDSYFSLVYNLDSTDAVIKPSEFNKILIFEEPWGDTRVNAVRYSSLVLSSFEKEYEKNRVIYKTYERQSGAVVLEMPSDDTYFGQLSPDYRTAYCFNSGKLIRYDIPEKKSALLPDISYSLVKKNWEGADRLDATNIKNVFYRRNRDTVKNSTRFLFYDILTGNLVHQVNLEGSDFYGLRDAAITENGKYLFFIDEPPSQPGFSIFDHEGKKLKSLIYKNEGLYSSPKELIDTKNHRIFFTDDTVGSLWKRNKNEVSVVVWDYENDTVRRLRLYLDM